MYLYVHYDHYCQIAKATFSADLIMAHLQRFFNRKT